MASDPQPLSGDVTTSADIRAFVAQPPGWTDDQSLAAAAEAGAVRPSGRLGTRARKELRTEAEGRDLGALLEAAIKEVQRMVAEGHGERPVGRARRRRWPGTAGRSGRST